MIQFKIYVNSLYAARNTKTNKTRWKLHKRKQLTNITSFMNVDNIMLNKCNLAVYKKN